MKEVPLFMVHDLTSFPHYELPEGYRFRFYGGTGDDHLWADILVATHEYKEINQALERFQSEFSPHGSILKDRLLFLETKKGEVVGTAAAWFNTWRGHQTGRLHWVEIKPEFQGQGLGKPLISQSMLILSQYHTGAHLKTQATSKAAIHLYRKFGWQPVIDSREEKDIWATLS